MAFKTFGGTVQLGVPALYFISLCFIAQRVPLQQRSNETDIEQEDWTCTIKDSQSCYNWLESKLINIIDTLALYQTHKQLSIKDHDNTTIHMTKTILKCNHISCNPNDVLFNKIF